MYIKKIEQTYNNGNSYYEWFLCDEKNQISIERSYEEALKMLEGFDLGSYEYLFNEEMLFKWKRRGTTIELADRLLKNPKAWVREIKIKDLLSDD